MTAADRLAQLQRIAQLLRDRDLMRLNAVSARKRQTEALLGALDKTQTGAVLDPIVAAQVVDRFGLWTTNRRILLNQQLARDTVEWIALRSAAQRSFGQAEVLGKLSLKR
ncbi:MAG: hypothetical protein Q7J44_11045 [Pseudotabrizicola sp.]|uniref:hypothetical protein n=1 Tax=Pseudotabrizicola sp. TaxID=2939647 RepID=UPI0027291F27|nr:hypothetical protein [Pseudotabrizicola sp.]MDO9639068.1 hypothetical protein [Pseudotabrizicola sp.]